MKPLDYLLLVFCGLLVWVGFHLFIYQKCMRSVIKESEKIWKDYTKHKSLADLGSLSAELALMLNDWDKYFWLSLYRNFEKVYIVARSVEVDLFSSEFMVSECSSPVVMKFAPFEYPFYNDVSRLWTSAAEQVRSLRKEIELVRFSNDGQVLYEKDWDTLVDIYGKTLHRFYSLKCTVEQLSATEAQFQNTLRIFPYNILRLMFPRAMPHNLAEVAEMIALGDSELNKHPIYIMQVFSESEWESQQLQQQKQKQHQQEQKHQVQLQLPQQQ